MASPFGLPSNYTGNNLYQQYIWMMLQQAAQQQQRQREYAEAMLFAQQNAQIQKNIANQPDGTTSVNNNMTVNNYTAAQGAAGTNNITNVPSQASASVQISGDGADDGKISGGRKFKNFMKGVGNFFKGMVCDENGKFSIKRTLTTAAVAAGAVALTVATGGAAAPFLVAGGAAIGAVQVGKGAYKAATAKTDAEAEAAWQDMGAGTTAVIGSVAGAKGALKSAGKTLPSGGNVTGSLKATGECLKIAGKGGIKTMQGIAHPFKSGRAIKGYWENTARPNLESAFSYKNGYKNYVNTKEHVANRNEKLAAWEKQIADVEAKLNNPSISAAEKTRLTQLRENLYEAYNNENVRFRANFDKNIQNKEQFITNLKNKLAAASEAKKPAIEAEIKLNEQLLSVMKNQKKIEFAQYNVERANADITKLKLDLKRTNITEAETKAINSRIAKIESAVAKDKAILRNSNIKIATQKTLPDVGIAYGTYYLAGAKPQVQGAMTDEIAQMYGFATAAEMSEIAKQNNMTTEQLAQYIQNQMQAAYEAEQAQQQAQTAANHNTSVQYTGSTNPYINYSYMNTQAPAGNLLGFNELYVSPYPEMI